MPFGKYYVLNEITCPLLRDTKNGNKVLERLFGTLTKGMAFGELAMNLGAKKSFYNAIALTHCTLLTITHTDYALIVGEVEKKLVNEKISYLKQIPEFESISLSRNKMQTLCNAMVPVTLIKN